MVVSAANSAARKRPRTPDQGPRAVEDQAVQATPRPGGPRSDEHGSELRSDADGGLTAVDLDADLDGDADLDLDDLDADDVDIQAALADEDLDVADVIADVAEVADDLAADETDGPTGPDGAEESEPEQPSADADADAEGPGGAGARVVKISPDGALPRRGFRLRRRRRHPPAAQVAVGRCHRGPG